MKRFNDDGRIAGVTTLLAPRGKIVHSNTFGRKDLRGIDRLARYD